MAPRKSSTQSSDSLGDSVRKHIPRKVWGGIVSKLNIPERDKKALLSAYGD